MTTWTPTSKSSNTVSEVDFLFSDATDLVFSDSIDFVFVEESTGNVWTSTSRNTASWSASSKATASQAEVDFLFSDATDLVFSDAEDFVFVESSTGVQWSPVSKASAPTYAATEKSDQATSQYELNIGSGYELLIGSGFKLKIQPTQSTGSTWTPTNKS